ncbi:MAG TPA: hypothetical protein VL284_07525 [Thermoanaerobaculia bacterium]|nr:hypothetical protein [Thermoanaerobaculia bacterium]
MLETPRHDHERTDANAKGIAIALGGLAIVLVIAASMPLGIISLYSRVSGRPNTYRDSFTLPPAPRLETNALADLEARRAVEMQQLAGARNGAMPIGRAMALVANTIPLRTTPPAPPPPPPGFDATQDSLAMTSGRFTANPAPLAKTPNNVPEGRH